MSSTSSTKSQYLLVGGSVLSGVLLLGLARKLCCSGSSKNPFASDARRPAKQKGLDGDGWKKLQKDRDVVIKNIYTPNKIPKELDAIVVGSGCGGLVTAAIMARAGKRVLVLEQHDRAGGATHGFADRGYEYDPGIHYIGEMQGDTLLKFFLDQLTDGQLQWEPMHRHFDTVVFGDKHIPMDSGKQEFFDALVKHFPGEKEAIQKYLTFLKRFNKEAWRVFVGMKVMPRWLIHLLMMIPLLNRPFKRFFKYASMTGTQVISQFTRNQELIGALTYPWGDYGLQPSRGSFLMTGGVTAHYMYGSSYPVGGSSQFAYYIIPAIVRAGGAVLVKARVKQFLADGSRVVGIEMTDGVQIYAPTVISDAGVVNTITHLLPPSLFPKVDSCILRKTRNSMSCISLFVGLRGTHEELGVTPRQYWYYRSPDYDAYLEEFAKIPDARKFLQNEDPNFPFMFVTFPSAKDPAYQAMYPESVTCSVITLMPYEWFSKHASEPPTRRSEEYNELKNAIGNVLWKQALKLCPKLADRVDYFEVGTPLTMEHYLAAEKGATYGIDHEPTRFTPEMVLALRPDIGIPGLFLTGQDIVSCGFGACLMSGLVTATACLGRNVFGDLMKLKGKVKATLKDNQYDLL